MAHSGGSFGGNNFDPHKTALTAAHSASETVVIPDNTQPDVVRTQGGRWVKGGPSPNPGGRARKLRDIERMLNKEHRNLDKMTEVFARLRALALGEVILIPHVTADGTELTVQAKLVADPAFMKLYLDRLLGPAKANDDEMDLSDAPSEVIEYLRIKVSR